MSLAQSIIGDLIALDEEDLTAGFVAPPPCSAVRLAQRFPYLDGYWNASDVAMVLDGELAWKRITFQANDAVEFRDPKAPSHAVQGAGWGKMTAFPKERHSSESRKTDGIMSIASFAGRKIGHGGCEHGYQSVENQWLCEECYAKYVVDRSLGFVYECG